jgi:hypothetical protein
VADRANYVFLPWVRQGLAAGIEVVDSLTASPPGVASVPVTLRVNDSEDVRRELRLYGPGDVTGIDPAQVVRREPAPSSTSFEPNYFPAVEFDRPDFPWLFTPARATTNGQLRPWLCLVVVRRQQGVSLRMDRSGPLPVLEIAPPADPALELPDLAESWAWAHAQVSGSRRDAAALREALAGDPAMTVSRLLCPRRLDPLTDYLACVVPTFRLGCLTGLGLPITAEEEGALAPAWTLEPSGIPVVLPVYLHWEFRTSEGGDFETLVRLLEPRKLSEQVGRRLLDISQPGLTMATPPPPGTSVGLEGALRVPESTPIDWPDGIRQAFQTDLKRVLDRPWRAMTEGDDPLLAPPIYGAWHAARHTVTLPPAPQTWLDELNLDPRMRAVAALGTRVVQAEQEPLMAAAWEQLGEIRRINQLRRQAQLGRAVNGVYHAKHLTRLPEETLLKVSSVAQARIVVTELVNEVPTSALLSFRVASSALPDRAISAPVRRMTGARGTISRRFAGESAPTISLMARLNGPGVIRFQKTEGGLVTIDRISDQAAVATQIRDAVRFSLLGSALASGPQLGRFKVASEGDPAATPLAALLPLGSGAPPLGMTDNADALAFRNAAKDLVSYLQGFFTTVTARQAPPLASTKTALLASLDPRKTIAARVQASFAGVGAPPAVAAVEHDPLEPVMEAPEFPQPMYEGLRDLSQEFLLPGLEHVPPNTVTLLETNPPFVEAYLVGLNAEMGRELLWRNYPTDQRGTCFRQFWGSDGPEIDPIAGWGGHRLGDNIRSGEDIVLLLRGDLLRRYPNSVIYAVAAVRTGDGLELSPSPDDERHPLFRGTLRPDVTFLGFDLTREKVLGDPGWFFVIQQQPTEPRFALDAADFSRPVPPLTAWNDLNWRHIRDTEAALASLAHVPVAAALPAAPADRGIWGRNAAHQAYITMQRPVRIAIHATEMIP